MRLRNKPWAAEKLANHPEIVIANPTAYKGKWKELIFKNENPIHIEVGTGKGQFVTGMAKSNPTVNYIGIEVYKSVIVTALDKAIAADVPNVKLLNIDAAELLSIFAPDELERVYLNFSDPWPKQRHAKRRLTYRSFLDIYNQLTGKNGEVHFKTDNQHLFEFSLESFSAYGMLLKNISLDLHKSTFEGNIMTEYEEKFSSQGMRIYRCEAAFRN